MSADGVVVFGATGLTGGLVVDALRARGVLPILAGRNERKLRALAARVGLTDEHIAIVVPDDVPSLARMAERGRVLISCAGPFAHFGEPVVAACATHGVHYVDSTGETPFVRMIARRYDATAAANDVALVPSMAFEVAVGDAAAARAGAGLEGPIDLEIAYAVSDFAVSNGTRASVVAMAGMPSMAVTNGELREEPMASVVKSVPFQPPLGESPAFSFASPEIITVPRHLAVRSMRTFLAAKRASWMPLLSRGLPTVTRFTSPLLRQWLEQQSSGGPSPERLSAARFQIVASASSVDGKTRRRVTVTGSDIYRLSAALLTEAALTLLRADPPPRGLKSPSEIVSPDRIFDLVRTFETGALHVEEWS